MYTDDVNVKKPHALYCEDESLTQQQFEHDANISNIMKKYRETGFYVDPSECSRKPLFGDFTNSMEFLQAQLAIANVKSHFESLPAHIRDLFRNNPALYLDYMGSTDEKIIRESIELGLRPKDYLANVSTDTILDVKGLTDTNNNKDEVKE